MNTKKIIFICLGILLLAVLVTYLIFSTEPTAKSEAAVNKTAMLVEVVSVERGNFQPRLSATGTVSPVEDVMLSPLVNGQIIHRSPDFVPGGFVEKGDLLLQIDPSDYQNAVALRESELQERQTDLAVEMGRQEVAEQDLQLAQVDSLSPEENALVLRQPQLQAVRARIAGARAAVEQARLDLARTRIRAPFDAHILQQNVTNGAQVAPGDNLGRLVGTEFYWVTLTFPTEKLRWLQFSSGQEEEGSPVIIKNPSAWGEDLNRKGYLFQYVGALEENTRLARVMAKIPDPLAYHQQENNLPRLMIGDFVEAEIVGKTVANVVRVAREYVRPSNTIWVMRDGKLEIRTVEIELIDSEYAYVSEGLEDQEKVVTTNLSAIAEGLELRTETPDTTATQTSDN